MQIIKHRYIILPFFIGVMLACGMPDSSSTPTFLQSPRPAITSIIATSQDNHTPDFTETVLPSLEPTVSQVTIYLVALEDNGANGIQIGCGDSLVPLTLLVEPTHDPVSTALMQLFSIKNQFLNEAGLYNSLYQSALKVEYVEYGPGGDIWVALSGEYLLGGECDNPRFQGQIEQTIRGAAEVSAVNVTINGKPLHEIVSNR
jgi:hypothetical protein